MLLPRTCLPLSYVVMYTFTALQETLEAIVDRIPPPKNKVNDALRALIFDSYYDPYRGVVCQFRVMDGSVSKGDTIVMMNTGKEFTLDEVGVLAPGKTQVRNKTQ